MSNEIVALCVIRSISGVKNTNLKHHMKAAHLSILNELKKSEDTGRTSLMCFTKKTLYSKDSHQ